MKREIQTFIIILIATLSIQAQEVTINTSLGAGYSNEIYYKLNTQNETAFVANSWDIAFFRESDFDLGVRVNDGVGIEVYEVANTPAGYDSVDITNQSAWTQLYNDDTNWNAGAFMNTSLTGGLAFGFGNYNPSNNTVEGQIVFVLKYGDGSYKKFFIESYFGGYTFRFSSWNGSEWSADVTETIPNSNNPNNRFNYYSLQNQSEVIAEPAATEWDFVFRRYNTFLNPPGQYYPVTGVLNNPNVQVAENDEPGGMPTNPNLTYSSDINTIGSDWKSFTGTGFAVDSDKAFYVKYTDNTIFRLTFTAFSGNSTGDLTFIINNVTDALNIADINENVSFGVYPNPTADRKINLVYDVTAIATSTNKVTIYSTLGQKVYETSLQNKTGFYNKPLDLSSLSNGIYMLKFTAGEFSTTKKIILK